MLVVLDGARSARRLPGLADVLARGPSVGVHTVALDEERGALPEECGATATLVDGDLTLTVQGQPTVTGVEPHLVVPAWAEELARSLAPLRDVTPGGTRTLPSRVRWLDLAAPDEQLAGWAHRGRCTVATLGRGPDGVFTVDLDRDGPHALVAGTTGSGKSELLQTLVASLAVGNRPDELTVLFVDYKGGAAFGPCARLPHTVGLVTDLDGALAERALTSLAAELRLRETVLGAAGAKDLPELHRRGGHLPRLVIVVDEFAALASELPDFVGGLVSIAQRGRSLGVHLVLATQRPEGVVSADIRANTNLRLCLAVARESESRDVLDSPLAATISRTTPGRGYARTGHGELTAFQTGRVGGRPPAPAQRRPPRVDVTPAADLGRPLPGAPARPDGGPGTDLEALVERCRRRAQELAVPAPRAPWLPALPASLVLPAGALPGPGLRIPFGRCDLPDRQEQTDLVLDLDAAGHLLVVGSPRSGRTTALRALAGGLAGSVHPDDVHVYALDLGGGLTGLDALPHCAVLVRADQAELAERVLDHLAAEVTRRQAAFGAAGHGGLAEQRAAAAPGDRLPHLLLLLDRWEAFLAGYGDADGGRLLDVVYRLLREGPAVGLHLGVTADRGGLTGRLGGLIDQRLVLRLAERGDYPLAGLSARTTAADPTPGRGWLVGSGAPVLCQVALLSPDPAGAAQVTALRTAGAGAPRPVHRPPPALLPLPERVLLAQLPGSGDPPAAGLRVPLGLGGDGALAADLQGGFVIGGPARSGRSTALLTLAAGLRGRGLGLVVVALRPSPLLHLAAAQLRVTEPEATEALSAVLAEGPVAVLVDDAELVADTAVGDLLARAARTCADTGSVVVAAGATDLLAGGYRGLAAELRRLRRGLLLCPQGPADGDLLGVRLPRRPVPPLRPGRGLLVQDGSVQPVQVALDAPPGGVAAVDAGSTVERSFDPIFTRRPTMADKDAVHAPAEKDPSQWVTGEEPATGPQESYLSTLAQQAGEQVETEDLTKAEASMKIDELKEKTGR